MTITGSLATSLAGRYRIERELGADEPWRLPGCSFQSGASGPRLGAYVQERYSECD